MSLSKNDSRYCSCFVFSPLKEEKNPGEHWPIFSRRSKAAYHAKLARRSLARHKQPHPSIPPRISPYGPQIEATKQMQFGPERLQQQPGSNKKRPRGARATAHRFVNPAEVVAQLAGPRRLNNDTMSLLPWTARPAFATSPHNSLLFSVSLFLFASLASLYRALHAPDSGAACSITPALADPEACQELPHWDVSLPLITYWMQRLRRQLP